MATSGPAEVVCIPYDLLLQTDNTATDALIEQAFGPDGLGVLTVSGVPGYEELREQLLPLAAEFAGLPAHVRDQHEDPESSFNFGWSHGKEAMQAGRQDLLKGSYYANPTTDVPRVSEAALAAYPSYVRPNIWPHEALPALEGAFKALGRLVVDAGLVLARHCDRYVASRLGPDAAQLHGSLVGGQCHKGRLLHYFPPPPAAAAGNAQPAAASDAPARASEAPQAGGSGGAAAPSPLDAWCGWHRDHGALTGLCSAMYIRDGRPVPNPDPSSGLYIQTRCGSVLQARIPAAHVGYQIGQVLAIQSGGLLQATPHCVRAAGGPAATGVSRNTFAVFMQPDVERPLVTPVGRALDTLLSTDQGHWRQGMSFGDFAERTMQDYYGASAPGKLAPMRPAAAASAAAAAGSDGSSPPGRSAQPLQLFVVHD